MIEIGDRLLYLAGVPPQKFEECLEWAFGKIDEGESMVDLAMKWNAKHSDIFTVDVNKDNPKAFIWSVGKAYVLRVLPDHSRLILPETGKRRFN